MQWHFLLSPPDDGPGNMARDEALMRWSARTGHAAFRVYAWSKPTLSLGRNQRARGCYDTAAAHAQGIGIVRRPTGGRALLHHREITYSATLRAPDPASAAAAYAFINEVLLDALARMGVTAALASGAAPLPPGLRPCFDAPSAHEIVLGAHKLVGSAQWRHGNALLQHGSILVRDDQHLIADLLLAQDEAAAARAATLAGALGRDPSPAECAGAIRASLAGRTGSVRDMDAGREIEACAAGLRAAYADDSWTWRR